MALREGWDLRDWALLGLFAVVLIGFALLSIDTEWGKSLLSGAAGGLLALGAEQGSNWLRRPKLKLSFSGGDDCRSESMLVNARGDAVGKAIYVRVKVENAGKLLARSCRAYLVKTESMHDDGGVKPTIFADSLPLEWSCRPHGAGGEPIDLPRGVSQYVDVVAIGINTTLPGPDARFWQMCFAVPSPVRYDGLFSGRPKKLRFTVLVSGDGVAPEQLSIDVAIGNDWNDVSAWLLQP